MRDATYVLDEILDDETELPLVEHTTDTAGYTDLIFALFDLLGMQFSPRIRDLGDQRLYRLERGNPYPHLDHLLKGNLKRGLIVERWDDLLRVAGSLKLGWATASLLIGKLLSYPRQNTLAQALQEYGKLVKTIFILRYLEDEGYPVREQDLVHLSPARYEHINPYGKYRFEMDEVLGRKTLRPLRKV